MEGLTYEQIAEQCHVCRETIYRDIRDWVQTGDFDRWLDEEWLSLHTEIRREDPKEAYRQLTSLIRKRIKQQVEADVKEQITVKMWED